MPWRVPSAASSALAAALAVFLAGSRVRRPPSPCMSAMAAPGLVAQRRQHDVARLVEGEAEHVEAGRDVRDGAGRKGGNHACSAAFEAIGTG